MPRISQTSFTRGVLAPALYSRTDLKQYSIGLKKLKNGFIHQEGSVSNRSGMEFIGEVKDSSKHTRIIPFVFNAEQTYVIEVGEHYFRFIRNGGYIIYPDNYGDEVLDDEDNVITPADPDKQAKQGEIVEIETPYLEKDLQFLKTSQSGDVLTIVHPDYEPMELARYSHYDWTLTGINFEPKIAAPAGVTAAWSGGTGNMRNYTYLVTAVDDKSLEESNRSAEVTVSGHREAYWTTSEYMTISWQPVEGAAEYNIYRSVNGIFGFLGNSTGTTFTDDNIEPDLKSAAPLTRNPFEGGNNPSCTGYFQSRKFYANSHSNPQTIWSSQTAASNNFNVSRPLIATDAVTIAMQDREVNEVRHLIGLDDLLVFTSQSEWKVNGADKVFQANPAPAAVIQSNYGASHVQPIISGKTVVFVQSGGNVLRSFDYEFVSDGYNGDELSIFANHLFEGKEIIYMAYSKEPHRLIFVIFSDGTSACCVYNPKQELCGWSELETKGKYECVVTVREGQEDIAYFVIQREIQGQQKRFIERYRSRFITNARDGFFVDCGLMGEFENPVTEIYGLDHLEGETVIVLADGGVVEDRIVQDGSISLKIPAKKIFVGLPFEFEIETLNVEGENTQGLKKIINSISVKIHNSREDFFVVSDNGQEFQNPRSIENINDAGLLISRDIPAVPLATPTTEATVHLKQKYPLPLTILSIAAVINVEDMAA
jgi:hypothetical protein